jgi:hypothetical protein
MEKVKMGFDLLPQKLLLLKQSRINYRRWMGGEKQ